MTANNQYYMGENHVPAYQMSASPFVTSSNVSLGQVKEIGFGGYVSRFIIVKNTGATSTVLSVGFTENGLKPANSNYFFLSGSESFTGDEGRSGVRVWELWNADLLGDCRPDRSDFKPIPPRDRL